MNKINFTPNLITKKLLSPLSERPRKVLEERFGLVSAQPRTLEAIGHDYGITRERVRQIEAFALNKVRQAETFPRFAEMFDELKSQIDQRGSLVQEKDFLSSLSKKEQDQHHFYFLLVVGDPFERIKEDEDFHHSWTTDAKKAEIIREALQRLHGEIDENRLFSEKEILAMFDKHVSDVLKDKTEDEILLSLLKVSRFVSSNALGEWGVSNSPFVRPRGMRDYAFLVMRRHGSPMHFSEVAGSIGEHFDRPAHVQTVHNELIKDDRFVLVGRGLYALKEWGYDGGLVRDVIEKILSAQGPLSKDEIIKKVLKERYVKENTILVNLQNRNHFKRDSEGNYALI